MVKNDIIFIEESTDLTSAFNGFYVVTQIIDSSTFIVKTGFGVINIPKLHGVTYKLSPVRYSTVAEVAGNEPLLGWKENDTLFIDQVDENGWAVLKNQNVWKSSTSYTTQSASANDELGASVAADADNSYMVAGRPGYNAGQGTIVIYSITSSGRCRKLLRLQPMLKILLVLVSLLM